MNTNTQTHKTPDASGVLNSTMQELALLQRLYQEGKAIQWEKSKKGTSVGRPLGTHSDPTADTALNTERLRVRGAVKDTERHAQRLHDEVKTLRVRLGRAIDAW